MSFIARYWNKPQPFESYINFYGLGDERINKLTNEKFIIHRKIPGIADTLNIWPFGNCVKCGKESRHLVHETKGVEYPLCQEDYDALGKFLLQKTSYSNQHNRY